MAISIGQVIVLLRDAIFNSIFSNSELESCDVFHPNAVEHDDVIYGQVWRSEVSSAHRAFVDKLDQIRISVNLFVFISMFLRQKLENCCVFGHLDDTVPNS